MKLSLRFYAALRSCAVILLMPVLLAACSSGGDAPASAAEEYVQAFVDKDTDRLVQLVCPDFEANARMSIDSTMAVETTVEDLDCTTSEQTGDTALVACTGTVQLSYDGEAQERNLAEEGSFKMVRSGDTWLVCGME